MTCALLQSRLQQFGAQVASLFAAETYLELQVWEWSAGWETNLSLKLIQIQIQIHMQSKSQSQIQIPIWNCCKCGNGQLVLETQLKLETYPRAGLLYLQHLLIPAFCKAQKQNF